MNRRGLRAWQRDLVLEGDRTLRVRLEVANGIPIVSWKTEPPYSEQVLRALADDPVWQYLNRDRAAT